MLRYIKTPGAVGVAGFSDLAAVKTDFGYRIHAAQYQVHTSAGNQLRAYREPARIKKVIFGDFCGCRLVFGPKGVFKKAVIYKIKIITARQPAHNVMPAAKISQAPFPGKIVFKHIVTHPAY